jgi:hypothetical protein
MYNQVLTNDGAALLRDAVNNSKKIVFTRASRGSERIISIERVGFMLYNMKCCAATV